MAKHIDIGAAGENFAAAFLIQKGYLVHFRNWRSGRAEVDIIASFDNQWIFVEVKSRSGIRYGYPEDFVNEKKKEMLREAAANFLWENNQFPTLRYDVVSILLEQGRVKEVIHFEDAFY